MPTVGHILAIDQGTTSTRALVFDGEGRVVASARRPLPQIFPQEGWVEHDPEEIWRATLAVAREALAKAPPVIAIGIANQRETTLLWDRKTGVPLANAIVWQDRRTADLCRAWRDEGCEDWVGDRTGLLLDPYFSASKVCWLLEHVEGARARAERGELAFGTVDTWLIWKLTKGARHVTDVTNASRTLLFNIRTLDWDREILSWLGVPRALMPEVLDCAGAFGVAAAEHFGVGLPILGVAGDQQAATVGQACLRAGMMKATYGTGAFMLLNTEEKLVRSGARLLTTVGYCARGTLAYALEGSIFMAGAAIDWLRDGLELFSTYEEAAALAASAKQSAVFFVPALVGLGAPYWDPHARGAIVGLTRDSDVADIVGAAYDAVCYQTRDLIEAMAKDGVNAPETIRIDGGMAASDGFAQRLADLTGARVERPPVVETTALGAHYLAALGAGTIASLDAVGTIWRCAASFEPRFSPDRRDALYAGWREAVTRTLSGRA